MRITHCKTTFAVGAMNLPNDNQFFIVSTVVLLPPLATLRDHPEHGDVEFVPILATLWASIGGAK